MPGLKYYLVLLIFILISCKGNNQVDITSQSAKEYENGNQLSCETLPDKFKTYEEAKQKFDSMVKKQS